MKIQIQNRKAFYEGCEVDYWNAVEVLPYNAVSDRGFLKDGTYPLPQGWDVVNEYFVMSYKEPHQFTKVDFDHYNTVFEKWPERTKQTVRLIRKEQKSIENCPTLFPCDCENECAVLKSQNSAPQELQKEELKKKHPDFNEWILTEEGISCNDYGNLNDKQYLTNRLFWAFDAGRNCVWDQYLELKKENDRLKRALAEMDEQADLAQKYNELKTKEVERLEEEIKRLK